MSSNLDREIARLAARQAGTFSRKQARRHGATDGQIRHRLRSGRWLRLRSGLYLVAGSPPHQDRTRWVSHLATGDHGIITHEGAAAMHQMTSFEQSPVVLSVEHPLHLPDVPAFVHQISDIAPHHRGRMRGLPVTTPARTVVDLAAVADADRISVAVQDLVVQQQLRLSQISRVLGEVARPGKPRLHVVARVLDELAGQPVPESELERALVSCLVARGVREPRLQADYPGRHATASTVDGLYDDEMVIVEADGRRWHARLQAMRQDRDRDNFSARAGYLTLRFLWDHILDAPDEVAATVADTLAARRASAA